jgi:RNA polymerase sigma factor (sigma-70 family)
MNIFKSRVLVSDLNDTSLVMQSLGGDKEAFCEIVTRYQNLLCSLAYSSVGDFKHSEDIAQDAFVEAWKKLDTLQDPEKLKAWLCGILRFKVSHFRRKSKSQPTDFIEDIAESKQPNPTTEELDSAAIEAQQQTLMWKVLESIDETYREPLILYYREQQSIERVAAELELTTDTVKQRLSRGRKLLKKAMTGLVEEGLKNSKPGVAFTAAVMAACSSVSPPAKAAMGLGAVKASSTFGLASILTVLASVSGLISSFFGLRAGLDQSRTERERQLTIRIVAMFLVISAIFVVGILFMGHIAFNDSALALPMASVSQLLVMGYIALNIYLVFKMFESSRTLRMQERIFNPDAFHREIDQPKSTKREIKTAATFLGAPLLHIQLGNLEQGDKPAFGWIAGGSYAKGLLFAWGGFAIAPVSVGIVSVGIFTAGNIGIGLFSVGTAAIGFVALGAGAIGYKAYSSLSSLGWESAVSGNFAVAKDAAIGKIAYAAEVNNQQAEKITELALFVDTYIWVLGLMTLFVIIPSVLYAKKVRQVMK